MVMVLHDRAKELDEQAAGWPELILK